MATITMAAKPGASGVRQFAARHPLPAFILIAYSGAWLAVLPLVLARNGLLALPFSPPSQLFTWLGALAGPALGAIVVTGITAGWTGVRELLGRYVRWQVGIGWYLIALAGPLAVLTLGSMALFGTAPLMNLVEKARQILPLYLFATIFLGMILGGPLGEEVGWRGFALPRLERKFGPLPGCLILGVVWGVWHLPGYWGGWFGIPFSLRAFAGLLAGTIGGAVIYGWLYNRTGSLLITLVVHSAMNAATGVGALVLPASMPPALHTFVFSSGLTGSVMIICAALVVTFTRGRLGYRAEAIDTVIDR